jgi:hypothetical protein
MKSLLIGIVAGAVMLGSLACSQPKQSAADKQQEPRQSAAQQVPTPPVPTATEVFHLCSECAKLGEKMLADYSHYSSPTQTSHYNPLTNRCYVELFDNGHGYHRHLYDGQTGEILAVVDDNGGVCPGGCPRTGSIFGRGIVMIQGNKALGNTDNEAVHDPASDAEAFINNVMDDDRKR